MPNRNDDERNRGEFSGGPRYGSDRSGRSISDRSGRSISDRSGRPVSDRPGRPDDDRFDRDSDPFGRRGGFGGDHARDTHRGHLGDNYARDGGWSGAGRADDYTPDPAHWGGTGATAQWIAGRHGHAAVGYGPGQTRGTLSNDRDGFNGSAMAYGETSYRGRGPKNWRPTDERIRDVVNALLTDHDGVDATEIDVTVENAEVTLTGLVGSRWEKRLADDIAHSVRGVHDVHNRLKVADHETQVGKASE